MDLLESFGPVFTNIQQQGDEEESMRNKLFRASESESQSEDESESDTAEGKPLAPLQSSTRPSPFQHQSSPNVKNGPAAIITNAKDTITNTITPPVSAPARADSEGFQSAIENLSTPTDSTVVSKEHEETYHTDHTDLSQYQIHSTREPHATVHEHQNEAQERKINLLSSMVSWLLQRQRHGWDHSDEELARLENVRKEVVGESDPIFASLLEALAGQERITSKYQKIIRNVVGTINIIEPEAAHLPQAPFTKTIDNEWRLLWDRCRLLGRTILNDRPFGKQQFDHLQESIEITFANDIHYKTIVQQSIRFPADNDDFSLKLNGSLARLLFIFVFEYPSEILQEQHSELLKHLYRIIGAAGMCNKPRREDSWSRTRFRPFTDFGPNLPNNV